MAPVEAEFYKEEGKTALLVRALSDGDFSLQ
jgi:hypothetical protein